MTTETRAPATLTGVARRFHLPGWLLCALGLVAGSLAATAQTKFTLATSARNDYPLPNGQVNAIIEHSNVVYIGGTFTQVATNTGRGMFLNASNGSPLGVPPRFERDVEAAVPDGRGGWFVGGDFQTVDYTPKFRLAHILPDFTLDPVFTADFDGSVNDLVLVGTNLYVGGTFTRITNVLNLTNAVSTNRFRFAILDPLTGAPRSLPSNPAFDGPITTLAYDGTRMYAGGTFTRATNVIAGLATNVFDRRRTAAFSLVNGQITPFQADVDTAGVQQLLVNDMTVFMAGNFTNVTNSAFTTDPRGNYRPRRGFAAVDKDTGMPLTNFWVTLNAQARALAVKDNILYVGGDFATVTNYGYDSLTGTYTNSSSPRSRLLALNLSDGSINTNWTPTVDGNVRYLRVHGTNILVAGEFNNVGAAGSSRGLNRVAAIGASADRPITFASVSATFDADVGGNVNVIETDGTNTFFIGGQFQFTKGVVRNRLAAFNATTGQVLPWNPDVNNIVRALAIYGTNVFAGGDFTVVNGAGGGSGSAPRGRLAAFDMNLGRRVEMYTNGVGDVVRAMVSNGTNLFVGGDFIRVTNGSTALLKTNVASFLLTSGEFTNNFTANIGMAGAVITATNVNALALFGTNLYVGGPFTSVNGAPRGGLAAVDTKFGTPNPDWICDVNGGSNVLSLHVSGSSLIVGGQFLQLINYRSVVSNVYFDSATKTYRTNYSGPSSTTITRNRIAALGLNDGSIHATWNPNSPNHVMSLATRGTNLYVGGRFAGTIAGQARNRLAEMSTLIPTATSWNPDADDVIWSLHASSNRVYAGGTFTFLGGTTNVQGIANFAGFESTNAAPVLALNTNTIVYTEGGPSVPVDAALRLSDANDGAFLGAVITITNYFPAEDRFSITQGFGIRFTSVTNTNSSRLTITMAGRAGIKTYQQLLRTLSYTNISLAPVQAVRSVQITVTDPSGETNVFAARPISVRSLNTAPTIGPITNIIQLAGQPANRSVALTGISTGGDSNQVVNLSAVSSDESIAKPLLIYANGTTNSTGSLLFNDLTRIGSATITVVVQDTGGTTNGAVDAVTNTFSIRVVASNSPPSMNALTNFNVAQDTGPYTNVLTGIDTGGSSLLTITATSSDPSVVPDPTIIYSAPDTTGLIVFQPVPRANGTITNTLLLRNGGLTNSTATNRFSVTVRTNVAPTMNPVADVHTNVSAGVIAVPLTGIAAGDGANQVITITPLLTSFTNFYPLPAFAYTSVVVTNFYISNALVTNIVGTNVFVASVPVTYMSVTNVDGTNVISTNYIRTNFSISLIPPGTNVTVTSTLLTNITATNTAVSNFVLTNITVAVITTNLGASNIIITNIAVTREFTSTGVGLTDISSDTISGVNVVYASPGTNGTVFVTPAPGVAGTGVVSLVVRDNGGVFNGGADRITNSFRVILAGNQQPTLDPIPNIVTNVSPGPVYLFLTGISAGGGERQQITVSATSDNTNFVNPVVTYYSSPDRFAVLNVTPVNGMVETATITVVVRDNGGTVGGGVDSVTNTFSVTTLTNTAPFFNIVAYDFITDIPLFFNPTNLTLAQNAVTNLWLTNVVQGIVTPGNTNLGQTLAFEVRSSNPDLVIPATSYTSANPTGILSVTPRRNASGTALITVVLRDNGGTTNGGVDAYTNTFRMTVLPSLSDFARNDFPLANGPVQALLETNGVLYLGGSFTELGTNTGKALPVNATNGDPVGAHLKFDRDVNVIIPDGTNGWYVGGAFQNISGLPRARLARLNADFSVDATFAADASGAVNALAIQGGELHVGGAFVRLTNYVNGVRSVFSRFNYALLNKTNGTPVRAEDPAFDSSVNAIALQTNRVFVGGAFTRITNGASAVSRFRLAQLDAAGIPAPGFQSDADAGTVRALAVSVDQLTLFVGGDFTRLTNGVNTFNRMRLAGVSVVAGVPNGFQANMSAPVRALWFMSNAVPARLLAGGDFTTVTGLNLTLNCGRLAALDPVLGNPSAVWTPGVNGSVNALWQDGAGVYVGGAFTSVTNVFGGAATARRRAVALSTNLTTNAVVQAWNPAPSAAVNAIALNRAGVAYVGGAFNFTRGVVRNRLGAIESATGQILPWNPNANNTVFALATAYIGGPTNGSNVIYAAGQFTTLGGAIWQRLAMLNTNAYDASGTNPAVIATFTNGAGDVFFTNGFSGTIRALAVGPTNLYVGGDFTNYRSLTALSPTNSGTNIAACFGLASVNLTNGAVRTNFMANFRATGASNVLALAHSGANLYVGGTFLSVTNRSTIFNRARLAMLDPNNGRPVFGFENNFNGPVLALQPSGSSNVLVGGNFTLATNAALAVVRHRNYALVDSATGTNRIADRITTPYSFGNPGFDPWFNQRIFALATRTFWFYAGGLFSVGTNSVGTNAMFRGRLAELTLPALGDSAFTEWNPDFDSEVFSLVAQPTRVYAGGQFTLAGATTTEYARPVQGLAVFESNAPPVIIPSPSQTIYTIGDPAIPVDRGVQVRDPNGALLARATVRITNNYIFGEDVLGYIPVPNGITGTFDPTNATLTLEGVAPIETYQTALRSVTYSNAAGGFLTVAKRRIEFAVDDGLGFASTASASQTLNVVRINVAPTLDAPPSPINLLEDAVTNLVLTGISSGAGDSNVISIRIESSNTNLFLPTNYIVTTNISVTTNVVSMLAYTDGNDTGLLNLTPRTNASGSAQITIIVQDDGGTSYGGVDAVTNTFAVVVLPLNDPPTITGPTNTIYLNEHTNPVPLVYRVGLSNITVGPPNEQNEQVLINFTARSSDTNLIPDPAIVFANANGVTTGHIELTVAPNQQGSTNPPTIITMVLRDNGGTNNGGVDAVTNTFLVVISTNQAPTLDLIAGFATNTSPGLVTVPLTGISGGGGVVEPVTITATSSDTGLIPSVTVTPAVSTNVSTALLTFTPALTQIGTALITVVARDESGHSGPGTVLGSNYFGADAITNTFVVTIRTNARPTLGAPAFIASNTSPGTLVVALTNITMGYNAALGSVEGGQIISISARSVSNVFNPAFVGGNQGIFSTNVGTVTNYIPVLNLTNWAVTNIVTNLNGTTNFYAVSSFESNFYTTNITTSNFAITNFTVDVLVDTNYTSPDSNAVLFITPRPGLSATSFVEVVVRDNGGTLSGGRDAVTNRIQVAISGNQPPTLALVTNVFTTLSTGGGSTNVLRVPEDPGLLVVELANITTGESTNNSDGQVLTVTVESDKPALVTPVVDYSHPNTTGFINVTPQRNASGTAVITVKVFDDGNLPGTPALSFTTNFIVIVDAGLADLPRHNFIVANGPVQSLLATNGALYFGGGFTEVGTNTGRALPVDSLTGDRLPSFPLFERAVNAAIPDGQGGWYLGGDFQIAGGSSRMRIAHLTSNLTVDPYFTPDFDGTVNALLLSGTNLYVGGAFTRITNYVSITNVTITTNFVTNLVVTTNEITILNTAPTNLTTVVTNYAVVVAGTVTNSTNFSLVLETNRFRFAVLDPVTGLPRSFTFPSGTNRFSSNPAFNNPVFALAIMTNAGGGNLFVGGAFTAVTNVNVTATLTNFVTNNRVRLAKIDLFNGRIDNNFFSDADAAVRALAVDNQPGGASVVYAGGDFLRITNAQNVLNLSRLAALNPVLGSVENSRPWSNHFNNAVHALLLVETNLIVGGDFTIVTNAAGRTPRVRLAVIDTTAAPTGGVHGLNLGWSNNVNGSVRALAMDTTTNAVPPGTLYIGGLFTVVNDVPRRRAAALDADFTLDTTIYPALQPFDPAMSGPVAAVAVQGPRVYLGGTFGFSRGALRSRLAAVNLATSELLPWNPDMNGNVLTLAYYNSNVYAGGQFTQVTNILFGATNTISPGRLAVINPTNGLVVQSFSNSFNSTVRALAFGGSNLYVGGDFTLVTNGGLTNVRVGLAAVNPTNGALNTNFVIHARSTTTSNVLALSYVPSSYYGDRLFVGGAFSFLAADASFSGTTVTTSGGAVRMRLASISVLENAIDFGFNCNLNGAVTTLIGSETNVYVGGEFIVATNSTGNTTVNRLFAADTLTGDPYVIGVDPETDAALYWAPNASARVNSISALPGSTNLYAGGIFAQLGGTNRLRLAELDKSQETNNASLWNPSPDSDVFAVLATPGRVVVAGNFNVVGPLPISGLAIFEKNVSTIVQTTPSPLTYTVGVTPPLALAVDPAVRLIDPNVAFVTNAIIRFETTAAPDGPVYIPGEDTLVFTPTNGITGQFYPAQVPGTNAGTLILTGSGTVDQYQDALRSVLYTNANPEATNRLRRLAFIVNDGSALRDINVIFTNYAPTVNVFYRPGGTNAFTNLNTLPGGLVLNEDAGFTNLLLTNITAGSNIVQFLTVTVTSSDPVLFPTNLMSLNYNWPSNAGTLRFASLTNYPFTTNPLSATFSVVVRDDGGTINGGVDAVTNTFLVTVKPVNDQPTLASIANLTIVEDNGGAPLVIPLDQIRAGGSELQTVTVSAVSSNALLVPNLPGNLAVSYAFPDSTGKLTIIPLANQRGTTTITVTVRDDGGTNSTPLDRDTISRSFTLAVVDQNDSPTMTLLGNLTILEDSGPTNLILTNIGPAPLSAVNEATQSVTVTAFISGLVYPSAATNAGGVLTNVATVSLDYTPSTNYPTSGTLTITPLTNAFGTMTVTVLVKDNGGTANGGVDTLTNTFRLTVTNVNDAPTLNPLSNLVLAINPPLQLIPLSGIASGPANETNGFTLARSIIASSSTLTNAANGATNGLSYIFPNTTGTLSFRPATNVTGTATITVTVTDTGSPANGGKNSTTNTFTVTVRTNNSPPTFSFETNDVTLAEDSGPQVMNLTSITAGLETQPLTMSVFSSDTNMVRIIATNYTSPGTTGQVVYASRTNANGTAVITVILRDNGGTFNGGVDAVTNTFTVTVLPVNDAPTLGVLTNLAFFPSPGAQTVLVTNITPGGGSDEAGQSLTLSASVSASSNPSLIPSVAVTYSTPNSTGQLSFTPAAGEQGTATIAVVAQDNGGTVLGGVDARTNTFLVQISANAPPTLDPIANLTLVEDPGQIVIPLTGISPGPYNEASQILTITVDASTITPPVPVLFSENFESGLGHWTGMNGGTNRAVIVPDPLTSGRGNVLTFAGLTNASIFTTNTFWTPYDIEISFDYLGLGQSNSVADDFGGLVGISPGLNESGETWLAATSDAFTDAFQMPDDGQWHRVTITVQGTNVSAFHLNLQDWIGSGGMEGDVYFDNITIQGYTNSPTPVLSSNLLALTYTNGQSTGQLSFTPAEEASGTATITITLRDNGGTPPGGTDTLVRTFTVTVLASNDLPTMNLFTNITLLEDASAQTLLLDGISTGGSLDERYQTLSLMFTNSNPALLPGLTNFAIANFTGTSLELAFTPAPDQSGTATITILLKDNGGTVNGSHDTLTNTFTITVLEVNDSPTLTPLPNLIFLEDAGTQLVPLSGIGVGAPGVESQRLTVTAVASDTNVIPTINVNYNGSASTGLLTFTPGLDEHGFATITVTVQDDGGTANGGVDTLVTTFEVQIISINDPPTMAPVANFIMAEDAGWQVPAPPGINFTQMVTLNGISAGPKETNQVLTFSVTSTNTALIPTPSITYTQGNDVAYLTFRPVTNANGVSRINVVVRDDGSSALGGPMSVTNSFLVSVLSANDPPRMNRLTNLVFYINAGSNNIPLSGINVGAANEVGQAINIQVTTESSAYITPPVLVYNSPAATGLISFSTITNITGTETVTVLVQDNGGVANGGYDTLTNTFLIEVRPINVAPTLNGFTNVTMLEDAGALTLPLVNVTAGGGEFQNITITATSSDTAIIPNPTIVYTNNEISGTLSFRPLTNANTELAVGATTTNIPVIITIIARDDGGTVRGGVDAVTNTFAVTVWPVNDQPRFLYVTNLAQTNLNWGNMTFLEDSGPIVLDVVGIETGATNENQTLILRAFADSTNLTTATNLTVTYTSPATNGQLTLNLRANAYGTSVITVTLQDGGGVTNGGINFFTNTFVITVLPVNDPPLAAVTPLTLTVLEDSGLRSITVGNIRHGQPNETNQNLLVVATTPDTNVISTPVVRQYSSTLPPTNFAFVDFYPLTNVVGTALVEVVVYDSGGTTNGGVDALTNFINITITPINDPPTLNAFSNYVVRVNAEDLAVPIGGISVGPTNEIGQTLTMTAYPANPALIGDILIDWNPTNTVGTLFFHPQPNAFGTTTISVVLTDDGGRQNTPIGTPRGVDAVTNTFRVIVTRGNTPPTIDPVPNVVIDEGAGPQRIDLTGITVGPINEATQSLTVAISSSNPTLVDPVLNYTFPDTTGNITFTPPVDGNGSAVITVTVRDSGGTATNGVDTTVHSIYVTINPVNDPPTLNPILTNFTVLEDSGVFSVDFSGVTASAIAGELQTLTAFAFSSDTNILLTPTVFYTSPSSTGRVFMQPATNGYGTATVSVVVQDSGGTAFYGVDSVTQAFTVVVLPVNDQPTIGLVTNRIFVEDAGFRTINITNVTSGPGESNQLTFTVLSSRPELVSGGNVIFTNTNGVATLVFAANTNAFGTNWVITTNITYTNPVVQNTVITNFDGVNFTVSNVLTTNYTEVMENITNTIPFHLSGQALITVVVTDDGGTDNGGINSASTTFLVEVTPVNDPPRMNPFTNRMSLLVDAGTQVVNLSGISPGPENESLQAFFNAKVTNYFYTLVDQVVQMPVTVGVISNNTVILTNDFVPVTNQIAVFTNSVVTNEVLLVTNQSLTITATSSNPGLIPPPQVLYTDQQTTAELVFTPSTGQTGLVTITVILTDDGGRAGGGINSTTNTFLVTVFSQNAQPTLAFIPNMTILEGVTFTNVNLYEITAGASEEQNLSVTATSSNTNLVRNIIVDYISPGDTGQLIFSPEPNVSGTVTISVVVRDDGGTVGGLDAVTNTFTVSLISINDAPGLSLIPDRVIYENDPVVTLLLTNISAGGPGEGGQSITLSTLSSDTNILRNPTIAYISPQNTALLNLVPAGDANGDVIVTVIVRDNGGTAFGGIDASTNTFVVSVIPVNDAPRFTVTNMTILEDSPGNVAFITNITSGASNELQTMTVTAFSSDTTMIPDPIVIYTNFLNTNGINVASAQLILRPLTNMSGVVTMSVVVQDDGGTENGGVDSTTNTFTVTILPVNDPPSFSPLANLYLQAGFGAVNVPITNIRPGPADETNQTIVITAFSSNDTLIENPILVDYDSGDDSGILTFQLLAGATGTATITVIADDDGTIAFGGRDRFTNAFIVVVTRGNLPPTIAPLTNLFLPENAGPQTVQMSNITAGAANESSQTITISAFSSDPFLLTNPVVNYISPQTNGILTFTPVGNTSGVASITVVVRDNGSTTNGGFNTTVSRFSVTIFSAASRALTIQNFGPTNIVSWSREATTNGFVLQASRDLVRWNTVPPPPVFTNTFSYFDYHTNVMRVPTNSTGVTNEFFRLYRP